MNIVVNVSDAKCSNDKSVTLTTYSLGSCIGVTLYDPVASVGGMLHFQLPSAGADAKRAQEVPLMFADTGMDLLMREMAAMGAIKQRMKARIAGGAQMFEDNGVFAIGRRNHAAIRKILWQHGMLLAAENVGGNMPRTMYMTIKDGAVKLKIKDQVVDL